MPDFSGGYDLFAVVEGTTTIDLAPLFPGAGIVRSDGLDRVSLHRQRITHEEDTLHRRFGCDPRPWLEGCADAGRIRTLAAGCFTPKGGSQRGSIWEIV